MAIAMGEPREKVRAGFLEVSSVWGGGLFLKKKKLGGWVVWGEERKRGRGEGTREAEARRGKRRSERRREADNSWIQVADELPVWERGVLENDSTSWKTA